MNGEEKKTSTTTIFLIVGVAIVVVVIIFALFSLFPSGESPQTYSSGLSIKFNGNTTLKSNSYFNLNFTISNPYDIPLKNIKVWVDAGKLFTISNAFLNNATTTKTYPSLNSKSNVTYYLLNIKTEKIETELKGVPIIMRIMYFLDVSKNFTINAADKNSLKLYGGTRNMGIKEIKKDFKSPFSISFSYDPTNFVFDEKKSNYAPFKIIIENVGFGKCADETRLSIQSNENLVCVYNKTKFSNSFEILVKPIRKIEIPCNYTLSYLKEKEFDSVKSNVDISCNYFENKTFYFNILP
jgi:hypothetical protein